jgi:prephenate dehydrogenase
MQNQNLKLLKNKTIKSPFKKVGILGCGAIGGSIIKALKTKNKNILIFTLKRKGDKDINLAFSKNYIDKIYDNLGDLLNNVEILILATPIKTILNLAKEIKNQKINNNLIIIDVGSIKENIVLNFKKLTNQKIEFLGTHPMAGSDKIGFLGSTPDLFINYPWIITPHKKNKKETIKKVVELVRYLGSKPIILTSKDHDKLAAISSHLVFVLSALIFDFVNKNKKALKLAGTGFQIITELASKNPEMHSQIYNYNYKNIKKAFSLFLKFATKNFPNLKNSLEFFVKNKKNRDAYLKKN